MLVGRGRSSEYRLSSNRRSYGVNNGGQMQSAGGKFCRVRTTVAPCRMFCMDICARKCVKVTKKSQRAAKQRTAKFQTRNCPEVRYSLRLSICWVCVSNAKFSNRDRGYCSIRRYDKLHFNEAVHNAHRQLS